MTQHSKLLSPSASGCWIPCTAQPRAVANANIERESSPESELGTWKHSLAEEICIGLLEKTDRPEDMDQMDWNEVLLAVEMLEKTVSDLSDSAIIEYEDSVGFSGWRAECFGTADLSALDLEKRILCIGDHKFGRVRVSVNKNSQLYTYAMAKVDALIQQYGENIVNQIDTVRISIFQPKVSHTADTIEIPMLDLLKWDEKVLQPAQKAVLDNTGVFNPGPHCTEKYCPLGKAGVCPEAVEKVDSLVDEILDAASGELKIEVNDGNLDKLIPLMKHAHLIEKTIAAAFSLAHAKKMNGHEVPGFKLVKGQGRRTWKDEEEAKKYLKGKLPKTEQYKETFLTAPQAEIKLKQAGKLKHPRSKTSFQEHVEYIEGKIILVREDDPREEVFVNQNAELDDMAEGMMGKPKPAVEDFGDLLSVDDVAEVSDDDLFDGLL